MGGKVKFLTLLDKIIEYLVGLCIFIILLCVSLQVFWRYVLDNPLVWSEQLAKFVFVWGTFLGAYICVRKGVHVSMDTLVGNIKNDRVRIYLQNIIYLLIILVLLFLLFYGIQLTGMLKGSTLPAIKFDLSFLFWPVPISSLLMIFAYTSLFVENVKNSKSIKKDYTAKGSEV